MRILVLGGTVFLGRHVVGEAVSRGHDVTLFNRGKSGPDLFPELEQLRGDRDGGLSALDGRSFDAVVDPSGYVPRLVRDSARKLRDCSHYTFVSSLSVYASTAEADADESAAVGTLDDPSVETVDGATYGPLKAACEEAAEEELPGKVLNVRAGLIVGPYDPTDRFTYWPVRIAQGGDVLAPGRPDMPVQFIDGRDLASWIVTCAESGTTGVYNATGLQPPITMGEFLEACVEVSGSGATLHWVDQDFLLERKVTPWAELPSWVPDVPEYHGFMRTSIDAAVAAGMRTRAIADTIRATLEWHATRGEHELRAGLKREREHQLLEEWAAKG